MKRAYYYFFYKIYRSIEYTSDLSGGKFLTKFKASLVMVALEIWICMSLGIYYSVYTKTVVELSVTMPVIYIPLLIIIIFNYFSLDYKSSWEEHKKTFDNLPKIKNTLGGWIVFGIIILILANLIFSFYLMSQINWNLYR